MMELLTTAQMRGIEAAAMASGAVTGLDLMERAGAAVTGAILSRWPGMGRAIVLCGPGNNGGDGYVIARLLAAAGWRVAVFALAPPATPDARTMRARWLGPVEGMDTYDWAVLEAGPVVVDAMYGTGLTRPVAGGVWGALVMAQESGCPLVAVDILSGLCADSGQVRAEQGYTEAPASLTVTFQRAKLGHALDPGATLTGALLVADIGLEPQMQDLLRRDDSVVALADGHAVAGKEAGHKYGYGHVMVAGGGPGQGGAARLAARAALRIGAGLVTLACPPEALAENAARLDAVMLRPVSDAAALAGALADRRISVLCLGPGLGMARARALVPVALAAGRAAVLDADALTAFADAPETLFALTRGQNVVLTPHGGEFARLFPELGARSKVEAARAAAARAGCTVLLKGADTVIADAHGDAVIHAGFRDRAAPWLATAGAGDVLAGFIAGLLARGYRGLRAAEIAAWLHVDCARAFGPGLIAEDLPEALPGVLRRLGL